MMQALVNGLTLGALYALVASGLLLIFGILDIPDFALGGRLMVGAYCGYFMVTRFDQHYWVGVLASIAIAVVLGLLSEVVVYRHLRRGSATNGFIGALALLAAMEIGAQVLWRADYRKFDSPYDNTIVHIGSAAVSQQRLMAAFIALALIVGMHAYLRLTDSGRAMRASTEDPVGALVVGISPTRMALLAMAVGSAMAGAAGGLLGPIYLVYPHMGSTIVIKAFIVVVLAGMRSSAGVMVGSILLGLAESFGSLFLSAGFTDVYAFVLLMVALIVRPSGLFAPRLAAR
ncbi:branched-chain amino acid ABC transporter permease [Actinomadura macra]|uniref:branched-chain amino acid ABC transporter permease n=1 Tax=Actinomadura macra TaxID=46164 RepID=UPI00082E5ED2|nr:branched-chain amino acid ABC transporter permease [Actinomadura macra]